MSFNIALTGLNAANQDLSVTANNLANVATTGFKSSRAEFGDLFASTQAGVSATAIGNGVAVSEVAQQFTQGNIETTGNNLDLAVSGNGFFTLSNAGALSGTKFSSGPAPELVEAGYALETADAPLLHHGFGLGAIVHQHQTVFQHLGADGGDGIAIVIALEIAGIDEYASSLGDPQ